MQPPIEQIVTAFGTELEQVVAVDNGRGQGRTCFARLAGQDVVVKWSGDDSWGASLERVVTIGTTLIGRGYPTAHTIAYGAVPGLGYAWIQQRLAGTSLETVPSPALLDEIFAAVELQADAGEDGMTDWTWLEAVVWEDTAGWWESARARDPQARRLVDEVAAWVQETGRVTGRNDYVHHDLNAGNILTDHGHLTGICDLDHAAHGDRALDLAALAFSIARRPNSQQAVQRIIQEGRRITGEAGWRQAVCYLIVSRYGWTGEYGHQVILNDALTSAQTILDASKQAG